MTDNAAASHKLVSNQMGNSGEKPPPAVITFFLQKVLTAPILARFARHTKQILKTYQTDSQDIPNTFSRYTKQILNSRDIPNRFSRHTKQILETYQTDLSRHTKQILKTYQADSQDIPNRFSRHTKQILKTYQTDDQDAPNRFSRHTKQITDCTSQITDHTSQTKPKDKQSPAPGLRIPRVPTADHRSKLPPARTGSSYCLSVHPCKTSGATQGQL